MNRTGVPELESPAPASSNGRRSLPPRGPFPWRTAFTIAWREARASTAKFLFVILAVALGVASLTGVRSFSKAFETMLLKEARTLMAADLTVRVFDLPDAAQQETLDSLEGRGIANTWITETVTMASSDRVPDPVLVSVKAVDPQVYPFYGTIRLEPPKPLAEALGDDSVVVGTDVLLRLDVEPGHAIQIGGRDFRIAAAVMFEPDRMTGSLNVGPRIMMTREALEATGLLQLGSRASQRFLFRLPAGVSVGDLNAELRQAFPSARIADFREAHPAVQRGLERSTTFLSLVSLIALIVGALGVATAMHAHLKQKLDSIAIMKCVGARSSQVIRIYALQAGLLGLAGSVIGVAGSLAVQLAFPTLIEKYFQLRPELTFDWAAIATGLSIGLLTSLLFTLPPLLRIREIRPGLIFRRDMPEARPPWRRRVRGWVAPGLAGAAILAGLAGIAAWLAESRVVGLYFAGGLAVSVVTLAGVAWVLLRLVRLFLRRAPWRLSPTVRHGLANLYRPGSQAVAVLVGLGVGVMFTLSIYLVQRSMLAEIMKTTPADMPNVFLVNITEKERDGVARLLASQPGLEGTPEVVPSVTARLTAIDGTPIEQLNLTGWERRFRGTRPITWAAERPADVEVLEGTWWTPGETGGEPLAAVADRAAENLGIKPGSRLGWSIGGRTIEAVAACIYKRESIGVGSNVEFILSDGALQGFPTLYWAAARVKPYAVPPLIRNSYRQFPSVTVINAADVLAIVQEIVDQVALVVRFVSFFAMLAGAVILASSVAGTRFRRVREVVILKTLGATRGRVARIFLVEFVVLGTVAGLMGSLLASGFSALVLDRLFRAGYSFDPLPNLLAVVATALVANAAGWLASARILNQKPLEVLRHE